MRYLRDELISGARTQPLPEMSLHGKSAKPRILSAFWRVFAAPRYSGAQGSSLGERLRSSSVYSACMNNRTASAFAFCNRLMHVDAKRCIVYAHAQSVPLLGAVPGGLRGLSLTVSRTARCILPCLVAIDSSLRYSVARTNFRKLRATRATSLFRTNRE